MARPKKIVPTESNVEIKSDSSIVKPSIVVNNTKGTQHPLTKAFDDDKAPVMKAVGFMRLGQERFGWVAYTITIQGNKVLSIDIEEPNLKAIAEEAAKVAFVQSFIDQD